MSPFKIGDRVVVQHPADGWRVMTVLDIGGDLSVSDGERWGLVPASEVRPAMPRDRHDLERWGRWWWRAAQGPWLEQPVQVCTQVHNDGRVFKIAWHHAGFDEWRTPLDDGYWRGPVARPPEVRS